MTRRFTALLIVAALLLTMTLAGCSGNSNDGSKSDVSNTVENGATQAASADSNTDSKTATDKLVVWTFMNEGEPVGEWESTVVDLYKKTYPNVDVQFVYCGRDILTKLSAILQDKGSPEFPDIVGEKDASMRALATDGLFYDLSEAFKTPAFDQDKPWRETFMPNLMKQFVMDGKEYFVPEGVYMHGFFYDKAMFRKLGLTVPKTWAEFTQLAETLKSKGIAPLACDSSADVLNSWYFIRYAEKLAGPDALDKAAKGEISFKDDPAFLEAAKYAYSFKKNGWFQEGFEGSAWPSSQALFVQGNPAMLAMGAWIPSEMAKQTPPEMEMGMFPVPKIDGAKAPNHEELWSNVFAVVKDGKNNENAINFLKIFSSKQLADAKTALKVPSPLVGATPVKELDVMEEMIANADSFSPTYDGLVAYGDWFNKIFGPLTTKLLVNSVTPEQFIDELDAKTKEFYKK